jgi:hypothetical protein
VRDLVAGGGVSIVLAQDRDRFAREPVYHYLLRKEFEEHETNIRALNDGGMKARKGSLQTASLTNSPSTNARRSRNVRDEVSFVRLAKANSYATRERTTASSTTMLETTTW